MRPKAKFADWLRIVFRNLNPVISVTVLLLMLIGSMSIYSATGGTQGGFFYKQLVWYFAGTVIMLMCANINYNNFFAVANWLYAFAIFLLVIVLLFGHTSLGAQRWIKIGGFQFQPSEFMKIVVPLALIRAILVMQKEAFTWKNLAKAGLIIVVPFFLILKQPDLGSAIMLLPVVLAILFIGNIPVKKIALILFVGTMAMPASYFMLKDYQKERLHVFVNPQIDPLGAGYNVIQSQIAVGSGQFLGKGWMQGTQSQLNFIPIKYTDFIYSVITEEFGFVGGFVIILIYFILIMEGLKIVKLCRYAGGKMLAAALTVIIFAQFAINIAMTMGLMPVTGITLPLLSYGGSSVLSTMIAIGILQNIYREYIKSEGD
jgi:rod shape determining protein RodA